MEKSLTSQNPNISISKSSLLFAIAIFGFTSPPESIGQGLYFRGIARKFRHLKSAQVRKMADYLGESVKRFEQFIS
ncbi:hypothetical protein [Limnoraphis robusta]|uniref:hypothetical protein n=1 Tax=Limnoraphis robusta TaxID=1118279 RepID=UPI002B216DB1|nr:hypothetical protein [Limnoraphis robusta]MEA5545208.1 hypothetical protein [Limnoraphis robusta CCNP1324]